MRIRRLMGTALAIAGTLAVTNGGLYLLSLTWLMTDWPVSASIFGFAVLGAVMIWTGLRWSKGPTDSCAVKPDAAHDSNQPLPR